MQSFVCQLNACTYDQLTKNTSVINVNTLQFYLWIHLPSHIARKYTLYQVEELLSSENKIIELSDNITREGGCWIKAKSSVLNTDPGQHIYKISLVDVHTDEDISLYTSYILQDDNPNKPYIYMNRNEVT